MRMDLTDITVVLDRSGSMGSCRNDVVGGLNAFVEEQKKQPGEALYTLVQFDNQYDFVHKGIPIKDVPPVDFQPRGGTALLDAIGRAIVETGERLDAIPEDQRPGIVIFAILTDGHENASREYSRERIKEMIEHQSSVYKWAFTYLGANQDAFAVAGGLGISSASASNYSSCNTSSVFAAVSSRVSGARAGGLRGVWNGEVSYTDAERSSMVDEAATSAK